MTQNLFTLFPYLYELSRCIVVVVVALHRGSCIHLIATM